MNPIIIILLFAAAGGFFCALAKFEEWLDWYEYRKNKKH